MEKKKIGTISHYFDKIGVAVIELTETLKVGDKISIEGHGSQIEQRVESMQIEKDKITTAKAGQSVGLKISGIVHKGAQVFLIE